MGRTDFVDNFMASIPSKQGNYFESTKKNLENKIMQLESFLQDFIQYGNTDLSNRFQEYFGNTSTFLLGSPTGVSYEEISTRSRPDEVARIHITGRVPVEMQFGTQEQEFLLNLIYQSDFKYAQPPRERLHTEFSASADGERDFIDAFNVSGNRDKIFRRISDRMIPYVVKQYFPSVIHDVHEFADYFYSRIRDQLNPYGYTVVVPQFNLRWSSLSYDAERDLCFFDQEFEHHVDSVISIVETEKNTEITYRVPYPAFRFRNGDLIIFPGAFDGSMFTFKQIQFDAQGWMVGGALGQAYGRTDGFELLPDRTLSFEERMLYRGPILQLPERI